MVMVKSQLLELDDEMGVQSRGEDRCRQCVQREDLTTDGTDTGGPVFI